MRGNGEGSGGGGGLKKHLCRVGGLNQNYISPSGTLYHLQVEDRGPVMDVVTEQEVRRLNLIVYANYGEPNARIIHGGDHDFPDIRSHDHNRFIAGKVQALVEQGRRIVDEKEQRQVMRIKCLIREYYYTKDEAAKREFELANTLFPFLFSRAWAELRQEQARAGAKAPPAEPPPPEDTIYPLDPELRERVLEIERVVRELGRDVNALKEKGLADDILLQTCRKLVARAEESLTGHVAATDFTARRLEMMRNSLTTTLKQVRSRLRTAS